MHFARTRKTLTAWLGLVAMALVLFAPMVSQALERHELRVFEQSMPLCEAKTPAAVVAELPIGSIWHDMPSGHQVACGYCDLLAEHVLAPTILPPMATPAPVHAIAWAPEPGRLSAHKARHAGRPRDSPTLL
ncbi:DUF2946 domain-containing protein [Ralstonia sp. 24A2]|uniref:DUF2946 domain-containing protein n=1 Tax=Ralstonia sp. 24A2 TaxID=3447364 RepID=UPI003F6A2D7F